MTQRRRRIPVLAALCAACAGACFVIHVVGPERFWLSERLALLELEAKDSFIANRPNAKPDPRLVFIGIDQPSYADMFGDDEVQVSPVLGLITTNFNQWSREVWASAIERLVGSGAKVVMLDLVFAAPANGDEALRSVLDRHAAHVVIGANFLGGNKSVGKGETILLPGETILRPTSRAAWMDSRVGYVNFFTDIDDVARRAVFHVKGEGGLPPDGRIDSLAARALEKFGAGHLVPEDTQPHLFLFSQASGLGYKPIPLYEIFLPSHWTNNFAAGAFFKDKIIIIGPAANIFHDEHRTPFPGPAMLGPELHLNVIAAVLRGQFVGETSESANRGLIIAGGLIAFLFSVVIRGPIRRLIIGLLFVAGYFALCWAVFNSQNFLLLAVTPMIAFSISTLSGFTYDYILERRERQRTRRTLERYVSKDVVREILDNPETYLNTLGGVRKPVTILFSDVRGFTTMSEGADPAQLVTQLNEYFKEMVGIVFAHHGSLDKFIGDAVMALWGSITTEGVERDAQNAVAAALAMRRSLARLNINWKQRGMMELAFGIGINHGDVIVGNIGSEDKMEVSVIGDPVNLASRLEGLTKEYKLDLLLGESVVPLVQSRFALRTVGSVKPKGKNIAVRLFTVVADKEAGESPPVWLPRYEQGIEFYRTRNFAEGAAAFEECLRAQPDDPLSRLYRDTCRQLLANPPGLDWDTVVVMKSK
jgi:adenylate cyclase